MLSAATTFRHPTHRPNELWQTDFTYLQVVGWGWYYLSTVLDDDSRYIIAWALRTSMQMADVTETHKLVNRQRLLETIRAGATFEVLILRDTSRFSRRDGDEAFGELKAIDRAGVQVWFYQDGTPFTHGTFGDNVAGFVKAEAAADYRRQIATWTRAAME